MTRKQMIDEAVRWECAHTGLSAESLERSFRFDPFGIMFTTGMHVDRIRSLFGLIRLRDQFDDAIIGALT